MRVLAQQPQPDLRALVLNPEQRQLAAQPIDDLGLLMADVIDILTGDFERHATSVVAARSGNATVIAD